MRFRSLIVAALWLAPAASPVFALDLSEQTSTFFLNGFGTLGGAYSTSDEASFIRDKSQPGGPRDDGISWETDSRLGLQGRWTPRDDIEAVLQIVSKYRYDGSYRPTVTWGFLKYAFTPDLELRAGRLGIDVFLNTDSGDAGYSYLWARPPGEFYTPVLYTHFNGVDLIARHPVGDGILKTKVFAGWTDETIAVTADSGYQLDGDMWGALFDYQLSKWLFRIGFSVNTLYEDDSETAPLLGALRMTGQPEAMALAEDLRQSHGDYLFLAAGIAYEDGPWRIQFGVNRIESENLVSPASQAATLSVGYRIHRWTPFVIFSRATSEHAKASTGLPDLYPYSVLNAYVEQVIAFNQFDQDTLSLGARFDLSTSAALKFQVDWTRSRDNPSIFWADPDPSWNGRSTVLSLVLDFVF